MKAILSKIIDDGIMIISNSVVEIESYKDYSKLIGCDYFAVVTTEYNGHEISIFVDDEGLLKPNFGRKVVNYPEVLFGDIILTGGVDEDGETLPFPDDISIMAVGDIISDVLYITRG